MKKLSKNGSARNVLNTYKIYSEDPLIRTTEHIFAYFYHKIISQKVIKLPKEVTVASPYERRGRVFVAFGMSQKF